MTTPAPAEKENETKIYKARTRVLLDLILFLNIVIFIVFAVEFSWPAYLAAAFSITAGLVLVWMLIIRPLVIVELTPQTLTGRGPNFRKTTIKIRNVDIRRTNSSMTNWRRRYLWKDVWSTEEDCVRLYRRILGERQVAKIMTVIERYPFREGAFSKPQS